MNNLPDVWKPNRVYSSCFWLHKIITEHSLIFLFHFSKHVMVICSFRNVLFFALITLFYTVVFFFPFHICLKHCFIKIPA